jgi:hypothetical protein
MNEAMFSSSFGAIVWLIGCLLDTAADLPSFASLSNY